MTNADDGAHEEARLICRGVKGHIVPPDVWKSNYDNKSGIIIIAFSKKPCSTSVDEKIFIKNAAK